MRNLFKKRFISGQSILEYCAIATIIIVGILAMGPYVVRSVNSYFKSAEEQAQDSFRERIEHAPLTAAEDVMYLGPDCVCAFGGYDSCGDGIECARNQRMGDTDCNFPYCEKELVKYYPTGLYQCDDELDPLQTWEECKVVEGEYPIGETGFVIWQSNGCGYKCCFDAELAVPPECGADGTALDGMIKKLKKCGPFLVSQYFWETDVTCSNQCGPKDALASWCSATTYNYDVPSNNMIVHVVDGGCLTAAAACDPATQDCPDDAWTCMAECPASFCTDSFGCFCPADWKEVPLAGACPQGFVAQIGVACPNGYTTYDFSDQSTIPCS
ncbi:MAG: hypothetical protein AB1650_06360 [Candidatus Omnitrophota bacterium]